MKTADYANEILIAYKGNISHAAKAMKVSRMAFYNWVDDEKPHMFSDEHALQAAKLLNLDEDEVLQNILLERTKCPEARAIWEKMFSNMAGHAAGIVLAVVVSFLYLAPNGESYAAPYSASEAPAMSIMLSSPNTLIACIILLISLGLNINTRASLRRRP